MTTAVLSVNEKLIAPYGHFTFYIVGAGGTGSYLVRDLARIVAITNEKYRRVDDIVIIDGDEVK